MDEAKIRLSQKEMELLSNASWILTKNEILQKIEQLLGRLQQSYKEHIGHSSSHLPAEALAISPKISKGENYKGLPYRILDYPRLFDQQDVFAIRTFFWWGNFFSLTLQLSGSYKKEYEEKIMASLAWLRQMGFYYCVHEDAWQHHFDKDNYLPLSVLTDDEVRKLTEGRSFVKLATRFDLQQWDDSISILQERFQGIIKMLGS
jgi:hypothetical protein